jgi:hypothetical protein
LKISFISTEIQLGSDIRIYVCTSRLIIILNTFDAPISSKLCFILGKGNEWFAQLAKRVLYSQYKK